MAYTVINGLEDDIEFQKIVGNMKSLLSNNTSVNNQDSNWIDLNKYDIRYCVGCDYCVKINPGQCAVNDEQRHILKQFMASETVLILTSIHFGCCNTQIKNFMDRSEPLFLPYQINCGHGTIMKGRYCKYPKLVVVGIGDVGEEEKKCFCDFVKNSNLSQVCRNTSVRVLPKKEQQMDWSKFIEEELIHE